MTRPFTNFLSCNATQYSGDFVTKVTLESFKNWKRQQRDVPAGVIDFSTSRPDGFLP